MITKTEKLFQEGETFLNSGQLNAAIESFKTVIGLEQTNSILRGIALQLLCTAYLKSAEVAQNQFDNEVSIYFCQKAIELDQEDPASYRIRAKI